MKRKKGIASALALALLLTLLPGFAPARAAESAAADANGYIVTLGDPAAGQAALQSVPALEALSTAQGVYRADSLDEVEALGSRVKSVEPDYTAHLLALPNDKYIAEEWTVEALHMDTETTLFIGGIFLPGLDDLIDQLSNPQHILVCLRGQT